MVSTETEDVAAPFADDVVAHFVGWDALPLAIK